MTKPSNPSNKAEISHNLLRNSSYMQFRPMKGTKLNQQWKRGLSTASWETLYNYWGGGTSFWIPYLLLKKFVTDRRDKFRCFTELQSPDTLNKKSNVSIKNLQCSATSRKRLYTLFKLCILVLKTFGIELSLPHWHDFSDEYKFHVIGKVSNHNVSIWGNWKEKV